MGAGESQHLCFVLLQLHPYPFCSIDLIFEYTIDSLFLIAHLRTRAHRLDRIIQTRLLVIAHETTADCGLPISFVLLV